jgi:hypothetical protein
VDVFSSSAAKPLCVFFCPENSVQYTINFTKFCDYTCNKTQTSTGLKGLSLVEGDGMTCTFNQTCPRTNPFWEPINFYIWGASPTYTFMCVADCRNFAAGTDMICYPNNPVRGVTIAGRFAYKNTTLMSLPTLTAFNFYYKQTLLSANIPLATTLTGGSSGACPLGQVNTAQGCVDQTSCTGVWSGTTCVQQCGAG